MSMPPASVPFDARPLTEPADRATVRAYVRQLRASGRAPARSVVGIVLAAVIGAVFLVMFGPVFSGIVGSFLALATSGGMPGGGLFAIAPIVMLVVIVGAVVAIIVRVVGAGSGERWWRLDRFAQANAMTWYPVVSDPPLPGMIFGLGHGRVAADVVRGERPRFVEFGNYTYKTGSGKNESTHRWGYVAVKLSTPLPNIVLDAVGNNSFLGSNLPASLDKSQRLSLEGDFDRYFTLFCPQGYEADALYLFTPDIMARFVDHAAALDAEIVDDWLFLYTPREASTLDAATWAWLFSVVAALLDKFAQWERWRDERLAAPASAPAAMAAPTPGAPAPAGATALPFAAPAALLRPPPGVAPQGRRLKRGVPWGFIVIFGVIVVVMLLGQVGVFGGLLGGLFSGVTP
ncbi:hypothetical protein [Microbacterium aurum]|jgi:hypothetical protein|uniref:hypothetical protein n=1 Tax=Microbacterium aurum TaxID=36805 RepID=UPI00248E1013|nr:hypothetical protein [Microbacterium aurum]